MNLLANYLQMIIIKMLLNSIKTALIFHLFPENTYLSVYLVITWLPIYYFFI